MNAAEQAEASPDCKRRKKQRAAIDGQIVDLTPPIDRPEFRSVPRRSGAELTGGGTGEHPAKKAGCRSEDVFGENEIRAGCFDTLREEGHASG